MSRPYLYSAPFLISLIAGSIVVEPALAQDGAAIQLGETDVIPAVRLEYISSDNTYRTEDDLLAGTQFVLAPSVDWIATRRLLTLSAGYVGRYSLATENMPRFADHTLSARADAEFTSRHRSTAEFSLEFNHNDIGEGILNNAVEGDTNDVAEFRNARLSASHTFGAESAVGNIRGGVNLINRQYTNLSQFSSGRDYALMNLFGEFGYRISADTRALLGARFTRIDSATDARDRNEITAYTGAQFSATGKLNGFVRLGVSQTQRDSDVGSDTSLLYIDARASYLPSDFSEIRLTALREINNALGAVSSNDGTSPISTELSLAWERDWSAKIQSVIGFDLELFEADCTTSDYQTVTPSIELSYAVRRWLKFGVNGSQESRTVVDCVELADGDELNDFARTNVSVFVNATL